MTEPVQQHVRANEPYSIVFVLKGYPRLSESFIAQEIHGLERLGLNIRIVSLRHPTDKRRHEVHGQIVAPVRYLPEYLHSEPLRVFLGWLRARRLPGYAAAKNQWLRDLQRDISRNRIRRFGQAMVLVAELEPDVVHLHSHFLHTPASVTRYSAMMVGMPWTASAHARDIWTSADWELSEKLADCRWTVTCTALNESHLGELAPEPDKVELLYHGLDLERFNRSSLAWRATDGSDETAPVRLLSVGRAVEKKGYDDLLDALAQLPSNLHWNMTHIGGGELSDALKSQAERVGIAGRIDWLGSRSHDEVLDAYRTHDVFTLASRIASDGDRDGLPNVLVEAQSQGLACVATRTSGIPELVEDDVNGLLVEARDVPALAKALERAIREPDLRERLGKAGCDLVHKSFSMEGGLRRLLARFAATGRAGLAIAPRPTNQPSPD
jgi:glycosyltransferase involved in cell wall biosynthesis